MPIDFQLCSLRCHLFGCTSLWQFMCQIRMQIFLCGYYASVLPSFIMFIIHKTAESTDALTNGTELSALVSPLYHCRHCDLGCGISGHIPLRMSVITWLLFIRVFFLCRVLICLNKCIYYVFVKHFWRLPITCFATC